MMHTADTSAERFPNPHELAHNEEVNDRTARQVKELCETSADLCRQAAAFRTAWPAIVERNRSAQRRRDLDLRRQRPVNGALLGNSQ
jgi:hypothetical protein